MEKNALITALENEIIGANDSRKADMITMLKSEYIKAITDAGFKLERIYKTKDGRYKTKAPIQTCKKQYIDVLRALYKYYYGDADSTFRDCFNRWIEEVCTPLVDAGHRSISTLYKYKSDYARFLAQTDFEATPIVKIKASHIHRLYADVTAGAKYSAKTLADLKTIVNGVFDYAVNNDFIAYNVARQVSTKDLILTPATAAKYTMVP